MSAFINHGYLADLDGNRAFFQDMPFVTGRIFCRIF